jgi:vitamin B12 transporter
MNRFSLIFFLSILLTVIAEAQGATTEDNLSNILTLEKYVVTANRTPTDVANVSQSIDVIEEDDIDMVVASFGTDLLKKTASVDVIQYPGGTSGVSLRGFRPEFNNETNPHTLLLLNGRPVSSSMGNIPTNNIERIEVLKGPASAIYGPSAMGGVVNIITKKSSGVFRGSVFAAYGSYQTTEAGVSVGGNLTDKLSFDMSLDWIDRGEDYKIGDGDSYEVGYNNGDTYLNTGFTRMNGLARLGYEFNSKWKLDFSYDFSDQTDTGVPGPLSEQKYNVADLSIRDLMRQGFSLDLDGATESHHISSKIYYNYLDSFTTYSMECYSSSYQGRTNWKEIIEWGVQAGDFWHLISISDLAFGLDYGYQEENNVSKKADGSVRTYYKPDYNRTKSGIYAESMTRFMDENLILNFGGRFDQIETEVESSTYEGTTYQYSGGTQSFEQFSPRVGLVWKMAPGWRLHTSLGTAFIAPDSEQVAGYYESEYSSYYKISQGNADLNPETSVTFDLGLEYRNSILTVDVTYFTTKVDDCIVSFNTGETEEAGEDGKERRIYTYINADSQDMNGLEFTGTVAVSEIFQSISGDLEFVFNGTYMDEAEVESSGVVEPVKNIAEFKGNFSLNYRKGPFSTHFNARYNGNRWDKDYTYDDYYGGDWYEFPDYWVYDWSVSYRFREVHKLSLLVDNLFDTYYYEKLDYPQEGRNFTLRYDYEF